MKKIIPKALPLALILAATAVLIAPLAHSALIPGLYGTGVDADGALLGPGVVDPHYTLSASADPGYPGPAAYTLVPGFPVPPWVAEGPNSRWIAPQAQQGCTGCGNIPGQYTYRISFDLTGFDPTSAKIDGAWAVDNGGVDIRLNGVALGIVNNNGFGGMTSFTVITGFVAGTNVLEFLVSNADDGTGNPGPTGLRADLMGTVNIPGEPPTIVVQPVSQRAVVGDTVNFSVTAIGPNPLEISYQWRFNNIAIPGAVQTNLVLIGVTTNDTGFYDVVVSSFDGETNSVPAKLTVSLPVPGVFNTGVGSDGLPLADNVVDPHYSLVVNPDGAPPDAIVQDSTVFPLTGTAWLLNSTTSKWIGPRFNTAAAAGGVYTYRLLFDLTGFDAASAYLVGDWTSDNEGLDILLNGLSTGISQAGSFGALSAFIITNGFISGTNVLEFLVNNSAAGYTGLRVQNFRGGALPGNTNAAPPIILSQPSSREAFTGENVTFNVLADGTPPLRYQWYRGNGVIDGETNRSLILPGVTTNSAGSFHVMVSNGQGSTNSATVTLAVFPPIPGLFNTGVDNSGALLPNNTPDPHYFLVVNPDTNATTPVATTMSGGWPVGPWLAEGPSSRWLFPPGNDGTNAAHGLHVFATSFDLTGMDPNTAIIRGQWAADDNVLDVVINGRSLGLQNLAGYGSFTTFTITNGFVSGENSLAFIVNNGGDSFFMNPCGFRAELRGTAQPTTCIWPDATIVRSTPRQTNQQVTVNLPPGLNQSSPVIVFVTSDNPSVAAPFGSTSGSMMLTFPAGGATAKTFIVNAKTLGSAVFSLRLVGHEGFCIGTNTTVVVGETIVANPSFENNYNAGFPHYSTIDQWPQLKPGGTGVNDSSGPFWDNGNNPDRSRVAFAQGTGGIFQELWGFVPGKRYWLQFAYNVRNGGTMSLTVRFNGQELAAIPNIPTVGGAAGGGAPFHSAMVPFTATQEFGLLEFATLVVGDATLVLDAVSIVQRDDIDIVMINPSFEASGIPPWPGTIQTAPMAGWTATGNYGVNRSGEGPYADNGTAQDQRNVLLLQDQNSSVSQVVSNLVTGTTYALRYAYNARGGNTPRLQTTLGGVVVHEQDVAPVGGTAPYHTASIQFTATGSSVTLAFTQTAIGDNTVLIDNVRIIVPPPPKLQIQLEAGGTVRLSWPVAAAGYTLQSAAVVDGIYSDTGLPAVVEGDENVSYDTVAPGNKFYQLAR